MNTIDHVVEAYGHEFDIAGLSDAAVIYLVTYGVRKSMQDAVAGVKAKMEKEGESASNIEAATAEKMADRFAKIIAGEMDAGTTGPRLLGVDKVMAEIAESALRVRYAKAKTKWPTGKGAAEIINGEVAKLVAKYADMPHEAFGGETLREAANAQMARDAALADL